jgi:hypothetical protein
MTPPWPGWLGMTAALDDEALAALGNKGLVRRAHKEVEAGRLQLATANATGANVTWTGPDGATVTVHLAPGGPTQARCPCPVAGVCLHILAALIWVGEAVVATPGLSLDDHAARIPPEVFTEVTEPSGTTARETPTSESTENETPAVGHLTPSTATAATPPPPTGLVADLLAWTPADVNRAAGLAAVRRVAARLPAQPTAVSEAVGDRLAITWPDAPSVIALPSTEFPGLLVAGRHTDIAERAWKLEAVVRLHATHGQLWDWPDGVAHDDRLQSSQRTTLQAAATTIEALVNAGLANLTAASATRLQTISQRARLEGLPLLASLVGEAAARVADLASRSDDLTETDVLDALATAWALTDALAQAQPPLPSHLLGGPATDQAEVGRLTPLAARRWTTASGARGVTVTFWDGQRLLTTTTGRAAGQDSTFTPSWDLPLIWRTSVAQLCAGPLTVTGAEWRADGTLSPTTRTTATPQGDFDLDALRVAAAALDQAPPTRAGFGGPTERLRVVFPHHARTGVLAAMTGRDSLGALDLDEVSQEVVWPIRTETDERLELRLDADTVEVKVLTGLLGSNTPIVAIAVGDRHRPDAVFIRQDRTLRLISLSLTPVQPNPTILGSLTRRLHELRQRPRPASPPVLEGPFETLYAAVTEVVESVATTGTRALTPRQTATLEARQQIAADLGLTTLSECVRQLAEGEVSAPYLLRTQAVLHRLRRLTNVP